jgi:hypothetical protein
MNNLSATCIEQNDDKPHVMHEVRGSEDGINYRIEISSECPMTAIKIATFVPLSYWEKLCQQ